LKAPAGSALNCDKPMAVNLRTRTAGTIAPNIFTALAKAAPGRVQSATGLPVAINIYGRDAAGQIYSDHLFMGGGQGGSEPATGVGACCGRRRPPNVDRIARAARAGAGHREGLCAGFRRPRPPSGRSGQRVSVRKLDADGLPTLASVYPEGVGIEVRACSAASPPLRARRRARCLGRRRPGLRHRTARLHHDRSGDRRGLSLGGSGFGSAYERPLARNCARSCRRLRPPEAAVRDYGVVVALTANWTKRAPRGRAGGARRRSDEG